MFEFRLFDFGFAPVVPDKAPSQPSVGRESVRVSSSLHGDWNRRAAAAG
jgi:hypothetical protein